MKDIVTKQLSAVVLGNSQTSRLLFALLKERVKDSLLVGFDEDFHLLSPHIASINGVKTRIKNIAIEKRHDPIVPAIEGVETIGVKQKGDEQTVLIIGAGTQGVVEAINRIGIGVKIILVDTNNPILATYDSSVQEVINRYLKKHGVRVLTDTNVLSTIYRDEKNFVVAEQNGSPKRLIADSVVTKCGHNWKSYNEYGLSNVASEETLSGLAKSHSVEILTGDIILLPDNKTLTLSEAENIVDFLCGKKIRKWVSSPHLAYGHSNGISFFSFGMLEQSMPMAHTGYRKSVIKLRNTSDDTPTYFIKLITTVNGRIIGISGVVAKDSFDLDYLEYAVHKKIKTQDMKNFIRLNTPHAFALYEAIDSL